MAEAPTSVWNVADLIIVKMIEAGVYLNVLKLHKLLYYVQAWYLALYQKRCFDSAFQAWVHGPVNRPVYDRYKASKHMYSAVTLSDVASDFDPASIDKKVSRHIAAILRQYGNLEDDQLEQMTHDEAPWQEARAGYDPKERCEEIITDRSMKQYYGDRLEKARKNKK